MIDTKKLKELTNEVIGKLDSIKEQITHLQDVIKKRKLIDNDSIQRIVLEAVNFSQLQDSLKSEFSSVFPDEHLPSYISEIEEKIRVLDESLAKQKEIEEAKKVIKRFESITSDIDECKTMLKKYLDKLMSIDVEAMSVEEYKTTTNPYNAFYYTVMIDDMGKRAAKALTIDGQFDAEIINKLIFGKFYINPEATIITDTSERSEVIIEKNISNDVEITSSNLTNIDNSHIAVETMMTIDEVTDSVAESTLPFNISTRDCIGEVTVVSKKKTVPVDHKEFKSLMKNNINKIVLLHSKKTCSIPFIYLPSKVITEENLKESADDLVNAGYVDLAYVTDWPSILHINTRGYKALKKYAQNGSDAFLSLLDNTDECDYSNYSKNAYLAALGNCAAFYPSFCILGAITKEIDKNAEFVSNKEIIGKTYSITSGRYRVFDKTGFNVLSISLCLEGSDEAEIFTSGIKSCIESSEGSYNYVFISSDTKDECSICCDYLNEITDSIANATIVFYSIMENKYYCADEAIEVGSLIDSMKSRASELFDISFTSGEMIADEYKETGIITSDHSDVGVANIEYKDDEMVTTKAFKKDMKYYPYKAAVSILSECDNTNERFFKNRFKLIADKKGDESIMEQIFNLGYVNKISLEGFAPIYQINNVLEKKLSKSNISWLKANNSLYFKTQSVTPQSERTNPDTPYFTNMVLTVIGHLNASSSIYSCNNLEASTSSLSTYNFFRLNNVILHFSHSVDVTTYFISACIPNLNELPQLINDSEDRISKLSVDIDIFFISGYSKEECDSLYNYYHSRYDCFKDSKYFSYVISDDCFIDYETNNVAVRDDIQNYIEKLYETRLATRNVVKADNTDNAHVSASTVNVESDILTNSDSEELSTPIEKKISEEIQKEPTESSEEETPNYKAFNDTKTNYDKSESKQILIDDEQLLDTVCGLLEKEKYACASAYLKAVSMQNKSYNQIYATLGYAMNDPALSCNYTSSVISGTFDTDAEGFSELTEYFRICAVLRTLFQGNQHDYQYKGLYATIQGHPYLKANKYVSDLLLKLSEFKGFTNGQGIDAYADYRIIENVHTSRMIAEHVKNTKTYFEQYYNNPFKEKKALPRYLETVRMILKKENSLYDCLRAASEDDRTDDILEYVRDFLVSNFINSDSEVRASNIGTDKINEFIDYNWNEAGKVQREKHKSSKLVKELRNNLFAMLYKMLTEIADWYYYVSLYTENDNQNAYEHEKHDFIETIKNALEVCKEIAISGDRDRNTIAGNACIKAVLEEFDAKLDGIFIDNANRYYYVDFLSYAEIMLDDNFIPIIENELSAINAFSPIDRILRHADMSKRDINERIDEIFNRAPDSNLHLSDDYGCAKLIKEYLRLAKGIKWDDEKNDIEANTVDASKQIQLIKSNFIGTLELDQSYGKIDIDRKERLLLLVDKQYERAVTTSNYGFFNRVLDYCKHSVDENASMRKADIITHLDNIKKEYTDTPDAQELIKTAEAMMDIQNYTVVEDIINRIQQKDFTNKSGLDSKDYLEDFIREYEKIFKIVYNSNMSNAQLITNLTRFSSGYGNKHSNHASNLVNNFPTRDNIQKVQNFLEAIGFDVDAVKSYQDKKACYDVSIKKPLNGKRDNYLHPIYPFGSYAVEKGFRVMCLFGKTDYKNLLDTINEIGTSKSTIIIVNWALELHDRRELARKIKANMPDDKIFIVIDRVVMYYLADKNEESTSSINRILMHITAPFASFQPYTEDASKAIPSEMFMGRTRLLRDIESPKGANVICGGRQLGKSALLRMAKTDINEDDVGNRAVYVEIKNLDHTNAALRVSQTLIDEGILEGEQTTDDWDELARLIKLRLNDKKKKRIPYFLLLIDEADSLFESSKTVDYNPIRALESLQTEGNESFKFVFAGLRNLVKFERELATDDNSTLPHITVKTIRPFNNQEARELLETPLHYLGVRFPKDKEYLISLILASTNYFPGLIHQYCASLIKAMQEKDYAGYTVATTPSYELTEIQIKKILSDENFNKEIKRKFDITLKLDTDNYYDIIATLVAYCSYNSESPNGFTVSEIMEAAEEYEISKIVTQGIDKLAALMDELCELNILRKNIENRYLFARHNFIQMLAKDKSEIDDKLIQYLGE